MKLLLIFSSFSLLLILFPPPCTITGDNPSFFKIAISLIKILNNFGSINILPPHLMTINSLLYLSKYFFTSSTIGPFSGKIFINSSSLTTSSKKFLQSFFSL